MITLCLVFFFQAEDGIRDRTVTGVQTCALPILTINTVEAQDRVAVQTAEMVIEALHGSIFVSAVNLPFEGVTDADAKGLVNLSEKLGLFTAQIIDGAVTRAVIEAWGI